MNLVTLNSRIIDLDLIQMAYKTYSLSGEIPYFYLSLRGINESIRLSQSEYTKLQKIVSQQESSKTIPDNYCQMCGRKLGSD